MSELLTGAAAGAGTLCHQLPCCSPCRDVPEQPLRASRFLLEQKALVPSLGIGRTRRLSLIRQPCHLIVPRHFPPRICRGGNHPSLVSCSLISPVHLGEFVAEDCTEELKTSGDRLRWLSRPLPAAPVRWDNPALDGSGGALPAPRHDDPQGHGPLSSGGCWSRAGAGGSRPDSHSKASESLCECLCCSLLGASRWEALAVSHSGKARSTAVLPAPVNQPVLICKAVVISVGLKS